MTGIVWCAWEEKGYAHFRCLILCMLEVCIWMYLSVSTGKGEHIPCQKGDNIRNEMIPKLLPERDRICLSVEERREISKQCLLKPLTGPGLTQPKESTDHKNWRNWLLRFPFSFPPPPPSYNHMGRANYKSISLYCHVVGNAYWDNTNWGRSSVILKCSYQIKRKILSLLAAGDLAKERAPVRGSRAKVLHA